MAGAEYFGQTAVQLRDHIAVNTMRKSQSHTFAALIRLSRPQPRIIFSWAIDSAAFVLVFKAGAFRCWYIGCNI